MAKALRSAYTVVKRTSGVKVKKEFLMMHVCCMSILYYLFNHQQELLKFRNIFEMVWGKEENRRKDEEKQE